MEKTQVDSRNKIAIISDVHLGSNHPSAKNVGPDGIHYLTWDEIYQFEKFIDHIITQGDIFLILDCGDFFDNKAIKNEILKYFHTNIVAKLRNAKIGLIISVGNHDAYDDYNRVSSIEDLDYYKTQNCIIVRKFGYLTKNGFGWHDNMKDNKINAWYNKYIIPKFEQYNVGISFFPYAHRGVMKDIYYRHLYKIPDNDWITTRRTVNDALLQNMIIDFNKKNVEILKDCSIKLEIGHYGLDGCKKSFHDTTNRVELGEFKFNNDMTLPNQYDYCFFGHYHHGQEAFAKNVFHVGSFNYNNLGELNDNKQYILLNCDNKKIEFVSTVNNEDFSVRKVKKLYIDVPINHANPTEYVIDEIKQKVEKEVKYKIIFKGMKADLNRINIADTYDAVIDDLFYVIFDSEPIIDQQIERNEVKKKLNVLDLEYMWNEYILKYQENPNFNKIKDFGLKALHKAKDNIQIKND